MQLIACLGKSTMQKPRAMMHDMESGCINSTTAAHTCQKAQCVLMPANRGVSMQQTVHEVDNSNVNPNSIPVLIRAKHSGKQPFTNDPPSFSFLAPSATPSSCCLAFTPCRSPCFCFALSPSPCCTTLIHISRLFSFFGWFEHGQSFHFLIIRVHQEHAEPNTTCHLMRVQVVKRRALQPSITNTQVSSISGTGTLNMESSQIANTAAPAKPWSGVPCTVRDSKCNSYKSAQMPLLHQTADRCSWTVHAVATDQSPCLGWLMTSCPMHHMPAHHW